MSYLEFPVGRAGPGEYVSVTLSGYEADVYLVDGANAAQFKRTGQAHGIGAHFGTSPITLRVPSLRSDWRVIVVPNGGRVSASVQLIRQAG